MDGWIKIMCFFLSFMFKVANKPLAFTAVDRSVMPEWGGAVRPESEWSGLSSRKCLFLVTVGYIHAFNRGAHQPDLFPRSGVIFHSRGLCSVEFGSIHCSRYGLLNISIRLIDLYGTTKISQLSLFAAMHEMAVKGRGRAVYVTPHWSLVLR